MFRPVNRSSSGPGHQSNKSKVLLRYWDPNIYNYIQYKIGGQVPDNQFRSILDNTDILEKPYPTTLIAPSRSTVAPKVQ